MRQNWGTDEYLQRGAQVVPEVEMPVVSRFFGIIITIHHNEHAPPHFHATYGDQGASIAIRDFRLIAGHLHPRALAFVVEWAALHQGELLVNWELAVSGRLPLPIAPLD